MLIQETSKVANTVSVTCRRVNINGGSKKVRIKAPGLEKFGGGDAGMQ